MFFLFIVVSGCKDDEVETRDYPVIDTDAVTEISSTGATFNATVLNTGPSGISDHGFVFNAYAFPTLENANKISLGSKEGTGSFSEIANRNMAKGQTCYVRAYAVSKGNQIIVYGQDVSFVSLGSSPPEVADFNPKKGSIGDTITITGTGFSNVTTVNRVSIASIAALVIKASEDSLSIIVPVSVPAGEQEIKVEVGQRVVIPKEKFLLFPITLTTYTPLTFSFGDTIILSGTYFPVLAKASVKVFVINEPAEIIVLTGTLLKVIPSKKIIKPQGKVSVIAGAQDLTYSNLISLNKPIITSIAPTKGTKDTEVKITGNHFTTVPENIDVKLNNTKVNVISASVKSITVKLPSGIAPGIYPFSVTIAEQNVLSASFEIIKPSILSIAPLVGTWGTTVTITGENFGLNPPNNIVTFNGINAQVTSATSTELKVIVPETLIQKTSTISVKVLTADDQTVSFASPFILNAPTITDFNPKDGKSNTLITITGQNFSSIV
ncbi:MAG TPA: IPT/TIG domain-containing protein, partial [Chryseolinea sp.]|nr:IPT/TIG domain-containing protein [Chryseolinea sp.]